MMDLPKNEADLIDMAHEFARTQIAPNAPAWELDRRIGLETMKEAAKMGFTGIQVPVNHGGLGFSFSCKVRVLEIMAGEDFGFAMSLVNTHNVAVKLAREAPSEIVLAYVPDILAANKLGCTALTEPGAGSDVGAIETSATKVSNGWLLQGEKAWITNATLADVIIVYAQTEAGSGTSGIAAFVVDATRPGFIREPRFDLAGQHSIGTGGFRLNGYVARPNEMLAPPGRAFKTVVGEINGARTYVAAMCCGMVDKALNICAEYGRHRKTFGKPLNARQGWRWHLANAATDLTAARLLVRQAAAQIDEGVDAQLNAAQAKIFATRMAERHLPALIQAMGAEGLREQYPLGRHLIGSRVAGFVDGSTEMLLERVASFIR
ncbi:MAG: acyl-CoA dehydrogenase [Deltaproteobacteria bacterium]|jgi:alkylation response protein AidB-like acyl-CoA dehydrogenase|nr:MAG: acyl-CoA dehydrogenase [Deltaproteobacteria bacterium]